MHAISLKTIDMGTNSRHKNPTLIRYLLKKYTNEIKKYRIKHGEKRMKNHVPSIKIKSKELRVAAPKDKTSLKHRKEFRIAQKYAKSVGVKSNIFLIK